MVKGRHRETEILMICWGSVRFTNFGNIPFIFVIYQKDLCKAQMLIPKHVPELQFQSHKFGKIFYVHIDGIQFCFRELWASVLKHKKQCKTTSWLTHKPTVTISVACFRNMEPLILNNLFLVYWTDTGTAWKVKATLSQFISTACTAKCRSLTRVMKSTT
jgi:hypothetical protein